MEQGVRQGCVRCVLAPLQFNIVAAVINVVFTRSKVDKVIMDALVHQRKKPRGGGSEEQPAERASPDDVALGHA